MSVHMMCVDRIDSYKLSKFHSIYGICIARNNPCINSMLREGFFGRFVSINKSRLIISCHGMATGIARAGLAHN